MSALPPSADRLPPETGEIDRLLRDFFQSELPRDWPTVVPVPPRSSRWPQWRSRAALAASVLLLLFGHWLLSGRLQEYPTAGMGEPGKMEATRRGPAGKARPVPLVVEPER